MIILMISVSWKLEYALIFLISLAVKKDSGYLSLRVISQEKKLPYRFLAQIATDLKNAGIVGSKEGAKGGYFLLKKPSYISLSQISQAIEINQGLVGCQRGQECKMATSCSLQRLFHDLALEIDAVLDRYTIADLINTYALTV